MWVCVWAWVWVWVWGCVWWVRMQRYAKASVPRPTLKLQDPPAAADRRRPGNIAIPSGNAAERRRNMGIMSPSDRIMSPVSDALLHNRRFGFAPGAHPPGGAHKGEEVRVFVGQTLACVSGQARRACLLSLRSLRWPCLVCSAVAVVVVWLPDTFCGSVVVLCWCWAVQV